MKSIVLVIILLSLSFGCSSSSFFRAFPNQYVQTRTIQGKIIHDQNKPSIYKEVILVVHDSVPPHSKHRTHTDINGIYKFIVPWTDDWTILINQEKMQNQKGPVPIEQLLCPELNQMEDLLLRFKT